MIKWIKVVMKAQRIIIYCIIFTVFTLRANQHTIQSIDQSDTQPRSISKIATLVCGAGVVIGALALLIWHSKKKPQDPVSAYIDQLPKEWHKTIKSIDQGHGTSVEQEQILYDVLDITLTALTPTNRLNAEAQQRHSQALELGIRKGIIDLDKGMLAR